MEEVTGSIPVRSTRHFNHLQTFSGTLRFIPAQVAFPGRWVRLAHRADDRRRCCAMRFLSILKCVYTFIVVLNLACRISSRTTPISLPVWASNEL